MREADDDLLHAALQSAHETRIETHMQRPAVRDGLPHAMSISSLHPYRVESIHATEASAAAAAAGGDGPWQALVEPQVNLRSTWQRRGMGVHS